jgi:RNA polymerase sigma factor (sigma-70 family)
MSNEEKKATIKLLNEAGNKRTSDYTQEEIDAIYQAANSDDHNLNEAAWLAVHMSLKAYEDDFLKKFGIYKNSQDYEDYVNELFTVIMTDLKKWNPDIGALTTHLKPRFIKACITYRNTQHSTFSSTHYELVHTDIKKAVLALEQKGNYNPTPLEIRNYIAAHKKIYSEQTIMNCLEQIKEISSIDSSQDISDSITVDPINQILQKERQEEIVQCIESLEPQHKIIMEIEYMICQHEFATKRKVTNKMIAEEFRKRVGPASDEWIKNVRDAAERDFQHRLNNHYYHKRAQFNPSRFANDDQMTEDIKAAIQKDIDAVFAAS